MASNRGDRSPLVGSLVPLTKEEIGTDAHSHVLRGRGRFLRLPQVTDTVGLSKTSIYEMIKREAFPSPVPIGKRAVGWIEEEIRGWAEEQIRLRTLQRRHSTKALDQTVRGIRKTA
ncbi:helix-turn-helix transcriptional regulator [Terriglobus roseus]|uniref:Transcriptional regulator, AlpA family n=1 Tax=Terriglobus roseus TaxID=392734 RepID=A0A1G7HQP7_9BACT|nr:transcriptional regulator, AlpA family [Terriglobus roseus]